MAKCKVCGSRVQEGISECPMCGAKIESIVKQHPLQTNYSVGSETVQNNTQSVNSSYEGITHKCKVCGYRIPSGIEKCPMCGTKIQPDIASKLVRANTQIQNESGQNKTQLQPVSVGSTRKCKACGSRIPDGVEKCPMCGFTVNKGSNSSQPQTLQPEIFETIAQSSTPVQPIIEPTLATQHNPQMDQRDYEPVNSQTVSEPPQQNYQPQQNNPQQQTYQPQPEFQPHQTYQPLIAPVKEGKSILSKFLASLASLAAIIFIVFFLCEFDLSSIVSSVTGPSYAKIEVADWDVQMEDYEFYVWSEVHRNMITEFGYSSKFQAVQSWTQDDKQALNYATEYLIKNYELKNNSVYSVDVYKYYNSDEDNLLWHFLLKYNMKEKDFIAQIIRNF